MRGLTKRGAGPCHPMLALLVLASAGAAQPSTEPTPRPGSGAAAPLNRALDVRALASAEAPRELEVRLRGWVTYRSPENFVLQDESAAIWVNPSKSPGKEMVAASQVVFDQVRVGSVVEVDGVVNLGGFSPNIFARELRLRGSLPLPPALHLCREDLNSHSELTERRQAEGTVTEVTLKGKSRILNLYTDAGSIVVQMLDSPTLRKMHLLGAEIGVEGVTAVIFNGRREMVSMRILANPESLKLLRPAPDDPFAVPLVPLGKLAGFSLAPSGQRRRTEGTVTYSLGKSFVLQQGLVAVRVRTISANPFPLGARVEVSGFLDFSHPVASLNAAEMRQVGLGREPDAVELSPALLRQAYEPVGSGGQAWPCDFDGLLVSVKGVVTRIDRDRISRSVWRLALAVDGEMISALLSPGKGTAQTADRVMESLRPGTTVRLTGIAEVSFPGTGPDRALLNYYVPRTFRVAMRTADDITVLKAGPWWTPMRFRLALAVALTIAVGALIRVVELRRTVRRQARRIEESLQAHRDAELEHQAARGERQRLAADLHDGVQQYLAGARYRMEAALIQLGGAPESVREQVTAAQTALERTSTELRVCMLGLREVEEGPSEFPELVRHCLERTDQWPREIWHLKVEGEPFPLSRNVMGNLLLFVQEAVGNAFKHAEPTRVEVAIRYQGNALELEVWDDGKGFKEPSMATRAGRGMGLETMRRRLRWLGGSARILSQLGEGTRVTGYLSRNAAQAGARALGPSEETLVAETPTPTGPLAAAAQDWCDPSI